MIKKKKIYETTVHSTLPDDCSAHCQCFRRHLCRQFQPGIGGNNLQKGARLSFYEFQAEHGGYVVKFYVQVVIHLTSVSIVRIPGTQRRVIMPKTRINISIDQDLADFAKIFAMENRTSVAEMVTQYLFKGVEKYVPGKEFQFPDMLN